MFTVDTLGAFDKGEFLALAPETGTGKACEWVSGENKVPGNLIAYLALLGDSDGIVLGTTLWGTLSSPAFKSILILSFSEWWELSGLGRTARMRGSRCHWSLDIGFSLSPGLSAASDSVLALVVTLSLPPTLSRLVFRERSAISHVHWPLPRHLHCISNLMSYCGMKGAAPC